MIYVNFKKIDKLADDAQEHREDISSAFDDVT
jgi:hypothetical protein